MKFIDLPSARETYRNSLSFVPTRMELPLVLNARGLCGCAAEIGVQRGDFSVMMLEHWHGSHLISVDPWLEQNPAEYNDAANVPQVIQDKLFEVCSERLAHYGRKSTVWRMTSIEAASHVPHHSLDFVYLDARHDFESVTSDLLTWFDRVRPGGILAGHDYLDGQFEHGIFQVKASVDEFCEARGLVLRTTFCDEPYNSWIVEVPGILS